MQIRINTNIKEVQEAMKKAASQVPFALSVAINASAEKAKAMVRAEMPRVFDRPTPWVLNSLRVKRSTKTNLKAELAYKDRNAAESSRSMVEPHVFGGKRHYKAMEARLLRIGMLPAGYNAVQGEGAKLDGNGNMSQGQISQLLNVLGAYTEAGYNKADNRTVTRLEKGNKKKNQYGFVYWVNKVGNTKAKHLPPGVYQRVSTGFGTSLKPVLIFVKQARYKQRLDFFGIARKTIIAELPAQFSKAFDDAMKTALLKNQGALL